MASAWTWIGFNLFVLAMLTIDLGLFHKKSHAVGFKEAMTWSGVWIGLALLFNVGLYFWQGQAPAMEFLTGYLIEKSLSVDNIFIFLLVFSYFQVPDQYQHKVLFWGILGALIMRGIFIAVGATLLAKFHWVIYLFGGFLLLTGLKMAFAKETKMDLAGHPALKLLRKLVPVTDRYNGDHFWVRSAGRWAATPLLAVLLVVECTDVIFALDSIPAIFAVTRDPFIVYTSNVFAILGLRSLYFALAGLANRFHYLKAGLAAILIFVGGKMMLMDIFKVPASVSLGVIASLLAIAIGASWLFPPKTARPPSAAPAPSRSERQEE